MFTLLRNGCPVAACRNCRRFSDDPRGMHSETCNLAPVGVAVKEHTWGAGVVPAFKEHWVKHKITQPGFDNTKIEMYRLINTTLLIWRWLSKLGDSELWSVSEMARNNHGHALAVKINSNNIEEIKTWAVAFAQKHPDKVAYNEAAKC